MRTYESYWVDKATDLVLGVDDSAQFRKSHTGKKIKIIKIGSYSPSAYSDIEKYGLVDRHKELKQAYFSGLIKDAEEEIQKLKTDLGIITSGHTASLINERILELEDDIEHWNRGSESYRDNYY